MIKILFYLISFVWIYQVMKDSNFLHTSSGGKVDRIELFDNYPCQDYPDYLTEWYLVKIGYYSFEFFFHCYYHRKRQDFSELFLHHFITNTCTFLSYITNFMKTGAAVLLPHDFSDIFIGILKMSYEFLPLWGQLVAFVMLFTSFVYTRLYVFPFVVIKQFYERYLETESTHAKELFWSFEISLIIMTTLHIFWTHLMVKGVFMRLISKNESFAKKNL